MFIEDTKQAERFNFLVTSYIDYTYSHRAVTVSAALSRKECEN